MKTETRACEWCCDPIPLTPGRRYWFIEQEWEDDQDHKGWIFRWYYHNRCWKEKLKTSVNE